MYLIGLLTLFSISFSSMAFEDISKIRIDEIKLELTSEETIIESSFIAGSYTGTDQEDAPEILGVKIYEAEFDLKFFYESDLIISIPVKMQSPVSIGVQFGAARISNDLLEVILSEDTKIKNIISEYHGTRFGAATILGGAGYSKLENEYGVKIKDWDFRWGSKLDIWTKIAFNLILAEEVSRDVLDTTISIVSAED